MTYVDLNPVRAGIAETPESSELTSVQERIQKTTIIRLLSLDPTQCSEDHHALPIVYRDYLELIDWTGRAVLENKQGSIPETLPNILQHLGIEESAWVKTMSGGYTTDFKRVVGPREKILAVSVRLKKRWMCGIESMESLYPT